MDAIETRVKRWGNSLGVVIPSETITKENVKENDVIKILILKDSTKALKETFGLLKGKLTKSSQQMKDESRKELY